LYLDEMVVSPYCLLTGEKLAGNFTRWLKVLPILSRVTEHQEVNAINSVIKTKQGKIFLHQFKKEYSHKKSDRHLKNVIKSKFLRIDVRKET
jgi:hypothetical protein